MQKQKKMEVATTATLVVCVVQLVLPHTSCEMWWSLKPAENLRKNVEKVVKLLESRSARDTQMAEIFDPGKSMASSVLAMCELIVGCHSKRVCSRNS